MATVIAVHGTFAHAASTHEQAVETAGTVQWWQAGSAFEQDLKALLDSPNGPVEVKGFAWSGDNSELGRRAAGYDLFHELRALEARREPYCVVGHSHGGSVVAAALLESAARNEPLANMKRWITVGTPFVQLRKENWLFTRLNLVSRAIFVASMMLLVMFLVYLATDIGSGEQMLFGSTFPGVLAVTAGMMSLPALLMYGLLYYLDQRNHLPYRNRVARRARETFGPRWLSLAHTDDEAIQGLSFLPTAKLTFFDRAFAVHTITIGSVIAVPLLYLAVLTSPSTMRDIGQWLRTDVYGARSSPEAEKALTELRAKLRETRTRLAPRSAAPGSTEAAGDTAESRRAVWRDYRASRRALEQRFPNLAGAERALRFEQRFFERGGKPCDGGQLCGGGHDLRINSGLLLHVVTDELSWAVGAAEMTDWRNRWIYSLLLPALLVPVIFGVLAVALMMLIRGIAFAISGLASSLLNTITNAEVKRAAYGNDTEGEIAVGASDRPTWLDTSPPRLPSALGDLVTGYSNGMATQSLAKFRRAIGQIASADPRHTADTAISTYFTWKELVHSAYFDVPEFRKLVAQAVSRSDGFQPSTAFQTQPDYARTAQWLAEIERGVGEAATLVSAAPTDKDAAAVSAVVASTVKAEP